jgi:hypothetical protein
MNERDLGVSLRKNNIKMKPRDFYSLQANYTDRVAAACRRS